MRAFFRKGQRFWFLVLAVATTCLVGLEAILLGLGTGYFTGGYQSVFVDGPAAVVAYLGSAVLFDVVLVTVSWAICFRFLKRYRGGSFRCLAMATVIGVVPATFTALVQYQIHVILGRLVNTSLLGSSLFGDSSNSIAVIGELIPPSVILVLLAIAVFGASVPYFGREIDLRRKANWVVSPRLRTLLLIGLVALIASTAALTHAIRVDRTLYYGLERKTSVRLLEMAIRFTTDWDRDGYGYLSRPADPAPFDSNIHPFAIEIPGNGIDENGLGGDLPVGLELDADATRSPPGAAHNPPTLLIFLETFRADLLDAELEGRPITPVLNQLAKEGARSDRMFVHSPWTLSSRDQLFQGAIAADTEDGTLLDDFVARGYEIAHFSGQDDSYGDSAERLGFLDARRFYDAREDVDRRTTRSAAPVSLQISWQTLLGRVDAFFDDYTPSQPLFLYVNIVDTHFPYTHSEIEEIYSDSGLSRDEIRASGADQVLRAYSNTAANVDHAVGRLIERWEKTFAGQHTAILVTADHGESFYESGTLGHGQTVASVETRVPLIVHGIGGEWPEPIGISDLRGLLAENLGVEIGDVHPTFRVDRDRSLFQYLGTIRGAKQIALRKADHVDVLDLENDESWRFDSRDDLAKNAPSEREANEIVWTWEMLQARSQFR